MTDQPRTMRTMTISWHEDAVQRAVDNAKAMLDFGLDDVRIRAEVPLTWQDVAVLVDIARSLDEDRAELQQWRTGTRVTQETSDLQDKHREAQEEIAALRSDLADAASNAATLDYVRDSLMNLLEQYGTEPDNVADALDLVKLLVDSLAWLHAEAVHKLADAHERARRVRENEHHGYLQHIDTLIDALGQHAAEPRRTLMWHIANDVLALREAYDTIENELIEWRTGQRAVEASVMQWGEVTAKLDATLAAVQQLTAPTAAEEREWSLGDTVRWDGPEGWFHAVLIKHVGGTEWHGRQTRGSFGTGGELAVLYEGRSRKVQLDSLGNEINA
jgi:hypothetical protein